MKVTSQSSTVAPIGILPRVTLSGGAGREHGHPNVELGDAKVRLHVEWSRGIVASGEGRAPHDLPLDQQAWDRQCDCTSVDDVVDAAKAVTGEQGGAQELLCAP